MCGLVTGGVVGAVVGAYVVEGRMNAQREIEDRLRSAMPPQTGDAQLIERVLERLLGAVVPDNEKADARVEPIEVRGEAEYEEPVTPVLDWTDPFIGLERPDVARLAPGQSIPGLENVVSAENMMSTQDAVEMWREQGEGAFEEWARESMVPEGTPAAEPWVERLEID